MAAACGSRPLAHISFTVPQSLCTEGIRGGLAYSLLIDRGQHIITLLSLNDAIDCAIAVGDRLVRPRECPTASTVAEQRRRSPRVFAVYCNYLLIFPQRQKIGNQ